MSFTIWELRRRRRQEDFMLIMNSGNWSSHRLSRLETEANYQKIRARLYPGHIKYTINVPGPNLL